MKKRRRSYKELELDLEMANGCLEMIRETMETLSGENAARDRIAPIFYNDWIRNTLAKKLASVRKKAKR